MKEIIAERDKSFFLLITLVGLISTTGCVAALIFIPRFLWFYIFGISIMGLVTLVGVIGLCFPKWVIIRDADNIIIQNGFRGLKKKILKITDIVGVKVQELPKQSNGRNGNIVLTIKCENSTTKDIVVISIKNIADVAEKLNLLIQK